MIRLPFCPLPFAFCLYLSSFLLLSSCEPKVDTPEPSAGTADFTRYVAIGSSYSSGFADGALSKQGQLSSFPSLLVQQMRLVGGAATFNIPLLKGDKGTYPDENYGPGYYKLTLPRFILVKEADCKGEVNILPERIDTVGDDEIDLSDNSQRIFEPGKIFHHLGIPAMKSFHFNNPGYAKVYNHTVHLPFSPYFWRFAPEPLDFATVFSIELVAKPTFFTFELGMSDVLSYAIDGGTGRVGGSGNEDITPVARFTSALGQILDSLVSQGAKGVVANVPDITTFPYFTTIEFDALDLSAGKADSMNAMYASNSNVGSIFHEGEHNPFVIKEDGVIRTIKPTEFVLLGVDVDSLKCMNLGAYHPISDEFILSEEEIESIKTFTADYNDIIQSLANEHGFPVVDLSGFMNRIYNETTIEGIDFSAEFASGGFFSLDGLHPSDRGQALLANEFIKVINEEFGAQLPLLNITQYRGVLFP